MKDKQRQKKCGRFEKYRGCLPPKKWKEVIKESDSEWIDVEDHRVYLAYTAAARTRLETEILNNIDHNDIFPDDEWCEIAGYDAYISRGTPSVGKTSFGYNPAFLSEKNFIVQNINAFILFIVSYIFTFFAGFSLLHGISGASEDLVSRVVVFTVCSAFLIGATGRLTARLHKLQKRARKLLKELSASAHVSIEHIFHTQYDFSADRFVLILYLSLICMLAEFALIAFIA